MALDKFFRRRRPQVNPPSEADTPDLWGKCPQCKENVYLRDLALSAYVCPNCGYHHRLGAAKRAEVLLDGPLDVWSGRVHPVDALNFRDTESYPERLARAQAKTGRPDAILTGRGQIEGVAGGRRHHGLRVFRRQHGQRGGRGDCPRRRAGR